MNTSKKQLTPRDLNWIKNCFGQKWFTLSIGIYYLFLRCSQEHSFVVNKLNILTREKTTHDTLDFDGFVAISFSALSFIKA